MLLDLICRVPHQLAISIADREGTCAVGVEVVVHQAVASNVLVARDIKHHWVAIGVFAEAVSPGNGQPSELVVITTGAAVRYRCAAVGEHRRVNERAFSQRMQLRGEIIADPAIKAAAIGQAFHAELFNKALAGIAIPVGLIILTPGTRVTFVGRHQIGATRYLVGIDCVRLIHAQQSWPGSDIDGAILVADVDTVAAGTMVLVTQRQYVNNGGAGNVDLGQGVVLLQADPSGAAIGGDSNVFGLQVLRDAGIRAENTYASASQRSGLTIECRKISGFYLGQAIAVQAQDAHRAFRIYAVIVVWFAFVGDQYMQAVWSKGQHIRLCANLLRVQQRERSSIK